MAPTSIPCSRPNLHYDFVPQFAELRIQIFQRRFSGFELGGFFLALTEQRCLLLVFFLSLLRRAAVSWSAN